MSSCSVCKYIKNTSGNQMIKHVKMRFTKIFKLGKHSTSQIHNNNASLPSYYSSFPYEAHGAVFARLPIWETINTKSLLSTLS